MKIVAVACVRDEIDIIEAFVRHTLHWVDHLVVLDNGSTDGTHAILEALRAEKLPVELVADPSPGKYQSRRITRLMRESAIGRHGADWVLPLDGDEFICVTGGGPLIPPEARPDRPLQLGWRTYVPASDDDPAEHNPALRLRYRLAEEGWPYTKVMVPRGLAHRDDAVITQGNHALTLGGRDCPGDQANHICLAHFPIRSGGQFLAKTIIGHLQNEVMVSRPPGWGFHHRENFEALKKDPTATLNDLPRLAQHYSMPPGQSFEPRTVLDPFAYRGGPLCHTPVLDDARQTWAPVLQYMQDLAREYGLLKGSLSDEGQLWLDNQAYLLGEVIGHLARQELILLAQGNQSADLARRHETQTHRLTDQLIEQLTEQLTERIERDLRRTWTWRAGRVTLAPVRFGRKLWRGFRRAG
jgi:hypothetical protein